MAPSDGLISDTLISQTFWRGVLSMEYLWIFRGTSMDLSQVINEPSRDYPLIRHGYSIDCSWILHGLSMGVSLSFGWNVVVFGCNGPV